MGQSWYHDVIVDGLEPGTAYAFTLPGGRAVEAGTWPLVADHVRIVARGDLGTTEHTQRVTSMEATLQPDLALYLGDWSYANYGAGLETQQEPADPRPWWEIWNDFFNLLEPLLDRVPGGFVLGNHEYSDMVPGDNVDGPLARVHAPGNERRWSVVYGGLVAIVAYDSFSHSRAEDATTARWLDRELAAVEGAPWVIVAAHHPLVGHHGGGPDEPSQTRQRALFAPVFQRHGVDLMLAGHIHCYQRSAPIAWRDHAWHEEEGAPVHVTAGTGGVGTCGLGPEDSPAWAHSEASFQWVYGTLAIDATPEELHVALVSEYGQIVDEETWP